MTIIIVEYLFIGSRTVSTTGTEFEWEQFWCPGKMSSQCQICCPCCSESVDWSSQLYLIEVSIATGSFKQCFGSETGTRVPIQVASFVNKKRIRSCSFEDRGLSSQYCSDKLFFLYYIMLKVSQAYFGVALIRIRIRLVRISFTSWMQICISASGA
jgi:hypothetical protein